jgi:hypothetical protein
LAGAFLELRALLTVIAFVHPLACHRVTVRAFEDVVGMLCQITVAVSGQNLRAFQPSDTAAGRFLVRIVSSIYKGLR